MSYWRLKVVNNLICVVEDYDYSDQDRSNFLRKPDEKDVYLKFYSEDAAIKYLNEKIKPEHIDPNWYKETYNQDHFFK